METIYAIKTYVIYIICRALKCLVPEYCQGIFEGIKQDAYASMNPIEMINNAFGKISNSPDSTPILTAEQR